MSTNDPHPDPHGRRPTPRNLAVQALLSFAQHALPIQETLDELFNKAQLEPRDRRQAAELAYGAARWLISLDHLIAKNSSRPLRRIEPELLCVIRIGLYQLLFAEGIPDFAAVSQAATQAKHHAGRGAAGFVNALLRSVQRSLVGHVEPGQHAPPRRVLWSSPDRGWIFAQDIWPDPDTNLAKHLSAAWAMPPWLVQRWLKRYGPARTRLICHAQDLRPSLWLRANALHCTGEDLASRLREAGHQADAFGQAVELAAHARPEDLPGFTEGDFTVQDAAAQHVVSLLDAQPGERILDLCAAPGGKTTALAEAMGDRGRIVASDISQDRLRRVDENRHRLGLASIEICPADGLSRGDFDAVLLDVPCSNTGVLARRVEARHRLRPVDIASVRRTQRELLDRAAALVRPAGRILYSTCSIEAAENELQITQFLQDHPEFTCLRQQLVLPGGDALGELPPAARADLEVAIPGRRHDGAYAALLIRPPDPTVR